MSNNVDVSDLSTASEPTLLETLAQARLNRSEIAGSLGDLGTFLPLLLGMAVQNGLNFATGLFFAGLFNVLTGLIFAIPMAVQPMKAIAAVALTEGLTVPEIVAAGASVSLAVLALGLAGLIDRINRVVPRCVIRGVQLWMGLTLLMKGVEWIIEPGSGWTWNGGLTALVAAGLVLGLSGSKRWPPAILVVGLGFVVALLDRPEAVATLGVGLTLPTWSPPSWADFVSAFPKATLPQLPLTLLNSVIAVCALSVDLYPDRPASPRRVAVSVGLMNLVGVWFAAMPMCHGAGGLAAQHRFGARTNGAILFLGTVKLILAVVFGASLIELCQAYPKSVLGVLIGFGGLELALTARDQTRRADAFVMLAVVGVALALKSVAIGFVVGMVLAWGIRLGWFSVEDTPR